MKRRLCYIGLIIGYLLVTFFGLGPVLFADGSVAERTITLIIVLLIYVALSFIWYFIRKRSSK